MSDDAFLWACERAVATEEYLPGPATLTRLAGTLTPEPTPYHLRALPAPDERARQAEYLRAEAAKMQHADPATCDWWAAKVDNARLRWKEAEHGNV